MAALACDHLCCLVRSLCPYVCAWLQMYSSAVPMNCYICEAAQFVAVPCTQAEFDRLQRRVVSLEAELAVFVGTRRPDAAGTRMLTHEMVPQLVVEVAPTVPIDAPVAWCCLCLCLQPCECSLK